MYVSRQNEFCASVHFIYQYIFTNLIKNTIVTSQQPEPEVKETPQDVIARANARGILDRISSNPVTKKEHHTHTKRMKKPAHTHTSQPPVAASKLSSKTESSQGECNGFSHKYYCCVSCSNRCT